jgi:hypothetical protein
MAIEITQRIGSSINDTQWTEVTAGTSIVRYIKLSTFLLLLAKKVFVPTLRNLQRGEKLEGGVPKWLWKNYADNLFSDLQPFVKWLLDRDQKSPSLPADLKNWTARVKQEVSRPGGKDYQQLGLLAEIWLHELSIRRCIWSWNDCTGGPSEALWKLYGNRGVAIKSEVGFVKSALEAAGVSRGIVAPVSYTIPRQILNEAAVAKSLPMLDKRYRPFPYLFKDASYRFEEEVRFVFGKDRSPLGEKTEPCSTLPRQRLSKRYGSPQILQKTKTRNAQLMHSGMA